MIKPDVYVWWGVWGGVGRGEVNRSYFYSLAEIQWVFLFLLPSTLQNGQQYLFSWCFSSFPYMILSDWFGQP